jgi:hypothetical protein
MLQRINLKARLENIREVFSYLKKGARHTHYMVAKPQNSGEQLP